MENGEVAEYAEITIAGSVYPSRQFYEAWIRDEYRGPPHGDRPIVAAADVLDAIERARREGMAILLVLDSLGGNNASVLRIYDALRRFPGRVIAYVRKAVSAMPMLAQAAQTIVMDPAGELTIHGVIPTVSGPDVSAGNATWVALLAERTGADARLLAGLFDDFRKMYRFEPDLAMHLGLIDTLGQLEYARRLASGRTPLPESRRSRWLASPGAVTVPGVLAPAAAHPSHSGDGSVANRPPHSPEARLREIAVYGWETIALPQGGVGSAQYLSVATNGTRWVAVGYWGTPTQQTIYAYSDDGRTWTSGSLGVGALSCVAWNGSTWVILGIDGSGNATAFTSSSGASWTSRTAVAGTTYNDVLWVEELGLFVAVGTTSGIACCATSPTGVTWTARTIPAGAYRRVAWRPGSSPLLVAVGDSGACATSPDAATWTDRTITTHDFRGIAYVSGRWVAAGHDATVAISEDDAVTWTDLTLPTGAYTGLTAYGNQQLGWGVGDLLFAIGNETGGASLSTSSDRGDSWVKRGPARGQWTHLVFGPHFALAVGWQQSSTSYNGCARSMEW